MYTHPTHLLMDDKVAHSPQGWKMRNRLINRCSACNRPALWIIENDHRNGHLYGDFYLSRETAQQVTELLHRKGFRDAFVTTNMLDSGYGCGLALEHLARELYGLMCDANPPE